jgi:hypothetical protein
MRFSLVNLQAESLSCARHPTPTTKDMNTTEITTEYKRRIMQAIKECDAFIAKEQPRNEALRPQEMKDLLAFYIAHRNKLQAMIA